MLAPRLRRWSNINQHWFNALCLLDMLFKYHGNFHISELPNDVMKVT